jgi:hypothetical protein
MFTSRRLFLGSLGTLLGMSVACGGPGSGPGAGSGSGGSTSAQCGDYFDAILAGGCNGSTPPADELARQRARFVSACGAELALPGVALTAGALETCATAVRTTGACRLTDQATASCNLSGPGTLGSGAGCFTGLQCQSGSCSKTQDGGTEPVCGTCTAAAAVGQPCSQSLNCTPNAVCDSSQTPPVCVAISYGDVGAACDTGGAACKTGLYCNTDGTAPRCASGKGAGATCSDISQCAPPFVCDGTPTTCQNPKPLGAACSGEDCATGLTCATGSTHVCAPAAWAAAGQPCSDTTMCLVGACMSQTVNTGTCPTVIPDGQPCSGESTSTTCDVFSECLGGTCVLVPTQCN